MWSRLKELARRHEARRLEEQRRSAVEETSRAGRLLSAQAKARSHAYRDFHNRLRAEMAAGFPQGD